MSTKKTQTRTKADTKAVDGPALIQVAASDIIPNPDNPRRDLGDLTELAASIASQGVQQPLVVTPADGDGKHMLIMGHRRRAASVKAGLDTLPCIVRQADTRQQAELMLTENIQRSGLTPMEEARGYARLLDLGETEDAMAKATGRSRATVRRRLKVAAIRPDLVPAAQVSFDQLEQIAEFGDRSDLQAALSRDAGTNNWNSTLALCRQEVAHAVWYSTARKTMQDLGLESVEGVGNIYDDPNGYEVVERCAVGRDLADKLSGLNAHDRDRINSAAIVDSGNLYRRGIILLRRLSEQELVEQERKQAERTEQERIAAENQLQEEKDRQAEEENLARLLDFSERAERLVCEHLDHMAKRATPLQNSRDILAAAVIHMAVYEDDIEGILHDPLYTDPWGEGTCLFEPDDKHRVQAAIHVLLKGMTWEHSATSWTTEDKYGLPMLRDYYAILAMTGYQVSDEEQQALDGSLKKSEEQIPQE